MRPRAALPSSLVLVLGIVFCALAWTSTPPAAAQTTSRTLLAVFAHPDDEQVVSPMLSRYAREGVRVVLAIATDGRKGVREHAGIPAGEALATARAAEARCACERLGIEAPILMGLEDGSLHTNDNKAAARNHVAKLITELKPDAVVTWGPDGVTGHTDHRTISNLVTEVIQRGTPGMPSRLFYAGLPAERLAALEKVISPDALATPQTVAVVAERYLPVRIPYTEDDARKAAESLACHKSQYTPDELVSMGRLTRTMEDGAVRLRPWFGAAASVTDIFK